MCGIAVIVRRGAPPQVQALERMREALFHRGPDSGQSLFFEGGGLAARRLAIMDPALGAQPLTDPSGRFLVALNGEIYNFEALRSQEEARGSRFRTGCDTEVLAAVIASRGFERALPALEGMFAIAAWDTWENTLYLARDRFGEKPLYYTTLDDGTFLAASELKGLLAHGGLSRQVDPASIASYLLFEYVPAPRSIYLGARRLLPGNLIQLDERGLRERPWWHRPEPNLSRGNRAQALELSEQLVGEFTRSVRERLRSDVPVGFLLSGGLDSSSVLAIASADPSLPRPLHSFHLGMAEPSFDESAAAAQVSQHLGTCHHATVFGPRELSASLDALVALLDEPLADSSLPATWKLFQDVREAGFKVVLSGDGGDELLAGYPTYLAHRLASPLRPATGLLRSLTSHLPVSYDNVSLDYKMRRFASGLGESLGRRNQLWLGAFLPWELPHLPIDQAFAEVDALARELSTLPPVSAAMALDQRFYLGDGVLVKVDRASMAHGVEVRTPFLDRRFIELAARVPVGLKLRGLRSKAIWKLATERLLPPEIRNRAKKGFGSPVGPYLRGPLSSLLDGLDRAVDPWVPPELTRRLVREHLQGKADHRRRLWALVVLGRWRHGPWGPG